VSANIGGSKVLDCNAGSMNEDDSTESDNDDIDNATGARSGAIPAVLSGGSQPSANHQRRRQPSSPSPSKEHIMTWRRQGLEMPIFIQFDQYPPHIGEGYNGRIRLVETTAIELSDLREQDEGWYECSLVSLEGSGVSRGDRASASGGDDSVVNGTWIYLAINGRRVSSLRVSTRLFVRSSAANWQVEDL
jgi:hypothetical protein